MKTRKLIGIVLMLALPLAISANMIWVPDQAPTLEVAVDLAMVGDTVVVPIDVYYSYTTIDDQGKNLFWMVYAIEPSDAPFDSTIYGPREPFPATPLE